MIDVFDAFPARLYAGQLQQRPVPAGGVLFQRDWFKIVPHAPAEAQVAVRYWDKAATAGGGDYTAGVLIVSHGGQWYIVDVVRGQWSVHVRNETIAQTARLDVLTYPQTTIVVE